MDRVRARSIAEQELRKEFGPAADNLVVIDELTQESPTTWAFVYNTQAYVETGDVRQGLLGNGPILVDKSTGHAAFGYSGLPIDQQLGPRADSGLPSSDGPDADEDQL